jgi:hypothetical protein
VKRAFFSRAFPLMPDHHFIAAGMARNCDLLTVVDHFMGAGFSS